MLTITNLSKSFGPTPVLHDINLEVAAGEIVCLLGPSGCGKTTLLRIMAGLESADVGTVQLDGQDLAGVPVFQRNFGLMFQEFALFPHKSVGENVTFGLKMAGRPLAQQTLRANEMLALVGLAGYGGRSIFELSGGERQRVALARSLAPSPRLLMLDEPLGSLDRTLREELMNQLRAILKDVGVTAIYVTHDQQEAFAVADRVVVMNQGRIEQIGPPEQVYARPASPFVARFLGLDNLLPARVDPGRPKVVQTPLGPFAWWRGAAAGDYIVLIRPQSAFLILGAFTPPDDGWVLSGTVVSRSFRGNAYRLGVECVGSMGAHRFHFDVPAKIGLGQGAPMQLVDHLRRGRAVRLVIDLAQVVLLKND